MPAERVIHWGNFARFDAPRGVPILAAILLLLADEEEPRHATLTNAWIQNCLTAFLTSQTPDIAAASFARQLGELDDNGPQPAPAQRNANLHNARLGQAQIVVLDDGTRVELADPKAPPANFDAFDKAIFRGIAANLGISYIALMWDFAETTYSGGRQADNEDRLTYQDISLSLAGEVLELIWREFVAHVYDVNRLRPDPLRPIFESVNGQAGGRKAWLKTDWYSKVYSQEDPPADTLVVESRPAQVIENVRAIRVCKVIPDAYQTTVDSRQ